MSNREIQLVDSDDQPVGTGEKLAVHEQGLLHRAFSVFIWRPVQDDIELLLHRRALGKYHSGGLWTNSCCSHPAPGEPVTEAARRRLQEELGLSTDASIREHGFFIYKQQVGKLIEHELDHVLSAQLDSVELSPDPEEVCDWRWMPLRELQQTLAQKPEQFTCWLPLALNQFLNKL